VSGLDVDISGRIGAFAISAAFQAESGITALFGRSGAGKSTILKMIAGTARPTKGRIVAAGRVLFDSARGIDLRPPERRIGFVFQDARLFPHMSVRRNLTYARWAGRRKATRPFDEVVALLGLENHLDRSPATLSGGERQRVAIGRALLSDPALLLMDEPLSSLDRERRGEILPYLEAIRSETRIPVLYVSHETAEVARLADTVVLIDAGQVSDVGPAARIFGLLDLDMQAGEAGALLEGEVSAFDAEYEMANVRMDGGCIELTGRDFRVGDRVRLHVRASDVALARSIHDGLSIRNQIPCIVDEIGRHDGAHVMVALNIGDQRILACLTRKSVSELGIAKGDRMVALLKSVSIETPRRSAGQVDATSGRKASQGEEG